VDKSTGIIVRTLAIIYLNRIDKKH